MPFYQFFRFISPYKDYVIKEPLKSQMDYWQIWAIFCSGCGAGLRSLYVRDLSGVLIKNKMTANLTFAKVRNFRKDYSYFN